MKKEEEFYDILRSKLNDRDISAEEQDWRNMRKMIDDSRERKRRLMWFGLSAALLLLCIGTYLFIGMGVSKRPEVSEANNKQNVIAKNEVPVPSLNNTNSDKPAVSPPQEGDAVGKQATNNHVAINTPGSGTGKSQDLKAVPAFAKTGIKQTDRNENRGIASVTTKHEKAVPISSVVVASSTAKSFVTKDDKSSPNVHAKHGLVTETTRQTTKDNSAANESNVVSQANSSQSNRIEESTKQNEIKPSENNNVQSQNQIQPAVAKEEVKKDSTPKLQINTASVPVVAKVDSTEKKTDGSSAPVAISQAQALPPLDKKPENSQGFSIEAGVAYGIGWKDNGVTQGQGIDPYIGLGYQKMFGFKWSVKTGIGVNAISGIGTAPFILKHTTYDFGLNSNDTTLTTKWLIYATLPLQVEYRINGKNAIGLGGTISYLLNGWGSVSVSSMSGDNNTTTNKTYNQYMYVEGYNRWNTSVFLLYRRTLFGRLSLYVMPYFGLSDIKSNSFFSQNTFERDSGIKLLLSYHIF